MTESNLDNGDLAPKVIHNGRDALVITSGDNFGPSGKLVSLVTNAMGRSAEASFCTGCHGREPYHLMAYVDNSLVRVYTVNKDRDKAAFDEVLQEVRTLELQHRQWFETGLRRWHIEFSMAG